MANRKPKRAVLRPGAGTSAVLRGEVDVTEWDDEELRRGRRRDRRGGFSGRPPEIIPMSVYAELRRRTAVEFHEMVRQELIPAFQVVVDMAKGTVDPDPTRLKAAQEIINRFAGRAPVHVELDLAVKPYEEVLRGGIVRDIEVEDDEDEHIYDAEVLDED